MGSSPSHSSRKPINERLRSQLSPAPTHTNGRIDEEESSSVSLQEPIDDEKKSNLSAKQTAGPKDTENQARLQAEENVEDDLGWLEETNQKKELTDQEILSRKNSLFRLLNKAINNIHKRLSLANEDDKWPKELLIEFVWLSSFIFTVQKIGRLKVDVLNKYRREAGQQLSTTQSVPLICNVVTKGWQKCAKQLVSNEVELPSTEMLIAMSVLWNFSDCSPEVTFDIIAELAFLKTLKEILKSYHQERIQGEEMSEEESKMIGAGLSIIHNLSKVDENITLLRERGFVKYVSPYLDSKTILDRFKALTTLSSLIDENESKMLLQGKYELLKMFLKTLETALQASDHTCLVNEEVWSALECTLTIHQLARNHANKPLLVQMGCLPHLTKLAKIGTIEETREAVGAIWYLAFDEDNQIKMLEDKALKIEDLLKDIRKNSKDKTTKEEADGTLRLLNQKKKDKAPTRQHSSSDVISTEKEKGHVMISYNSSHRQVLKTIRDKLKDNGYSVWMDIDDMAGSTIDAMADAVENSHVVLICMSQAYKKSHDCKSEAQYAYQKRKNVVALKMEKDYIPTGWLGFIVAADKYYDFSGKYDFETMCKDLLKRIAVLYSKDISNDNDPVDAEPVSFTPRSVARSRDQSSLAKLREWNKKQVNDWLDRYYLPKNVLGHLTGKDLAALIVMKDNASENFYRCLEEKLKLKSLSTIDTFIEALDHLPLSL